MSSTYTANTGIEKIGLGEQSGTWGTTTNVNFDIIDQALNGAITKTLSVAGDSGSPNVIDITDGALSDGRNFYINVADGADLGATAYLQLTPNDADKVAIIKNNLSGSQDLIVFQGTYNASNDIVVSNGKTAVLKFDGAGASATVVNALGDLQLESVVADVFASASQSQTIDNSNSGYIDYTFSGTAKFRMESDGDFHADGDVIAFSTTISDERLKEDVAVVENATEKLKQVRGVTFTRKYSKEKSAGIIAQDLEKVLPEAVKEKGLPFIDGNVYKVVEYDALHALLIEAVKDLTARVEELESARASSN